MREGHSWQSSTDEFEGATPSAVRHACFYSSMVEDLNLGDPATKPELGVLLLRFIEEVERVIFE